MQRITKWLVACAAFGVVSVAAAEEPLWELGVGFAALSIPDYRGSDERHSYVFPIPYFSYNGERLRIDRGGVHGDILHSGDASIEFSMNISPPADSSKNVTRAGMPDLDPAIEIGPSLKWVLMVNDDHDQALTLYVPARAAIASDFSNAKYIGWVFAPHLTYDFLNVGPGGGWNLSASAGPIFATEKYHDYYYEVRPEFATPTRPAFDAEPGYSGIRGTLTVAKRFPQFWAGAFARYDSLHGAVFEDSPMVREHSSFMVGAAISWVFVRSAESAPLRQPLRTLPPPPQSE